VQCGKVSMTTSKQSSAHSEKDDAISSKFETRRKKIDEIDQQLLVLINRRMAVAKEIGQIKGHKKTTIIDTKREAEVIQKLLNLNRGAELTRKSLFQIFTAVIAASREIQQPEVQISAEPPVPELFAVIGNPVSHSMSPGMHNCAFSATGYNGLYLPLEIRDIQEAVSGLKTLNFKGASITIPHKESIIDFLDAVDETARRIGAVNTVVNSHGGLIGYNTDGTGAILALTEYTPIKDRHVAVIGAGGAARAIGFGLKTEGGRITIVNRSKDKGEKLAGDLNAKFIPLEEIRKISCDILVNTTPVGMTPRVDDMCVPKEVLDKHMVVMDIVYNPLKTRLLREAEKVGCTTVDGLSMFIHQGAGQFVLWTGMAAPVDMMRLAVAANLNQTD